MIDHAQPTSTPLLHDNTDMIDDHSFLRGLPLLLLAAAVIGAILAGASVWALTRPDTPGTNSAAAGFARDMSLHHTQAVEMALIVRDTTDNDDIRVIATDIILTQQAQIGIMRGWLEVWDLPLNGDQPPMAWADMSGHDMPADGGMMVGMATADEINALREMSGTDADREFLRLMIAHHRGGVMMAEAALNSSDNEEVKQLAETIVASQQIEIDAMQNLLDQIGSTT